MAAEWRRYFDKFMFHQLQYLTHSGIFSLLDSDVFMVNITITYELYITLMENIC